MEYGSAATKREKQPELTEAHIKFQELGSRLDKAVSRLISVGNKLHDESGNIQEENKEREPTPYLPGLVSDFNNDIRGFETLISRIEVQLSKLENHI